MWDITLPESFCTLFAQKKNYLVNSRPKKGQKILKQF